MPSIFAALDHNLPRFTGQESLEKKVNLLQDYQYQLLEQLRWGFSHLDTRNMNMSSMNQWAETVTEPLRAALSDEEGNLLNLAITAKGLAAQISDTNGNVATLQATAQGLQTTVSSQAGQLSALQQTANSLSGTVANLQTGMAHSLRLDSSGAYITDQSGNLVTIQGGQINANGLAVDAANVSGNLSAGSINLCGLMNVYYAIGGAACGGVGGVQKLDPNTLQWVTGAVLADSNNSNYFIATTSGVRMQYSGGANFYIAGNGIVASQSITEGSDKRLKNNISYELTQEEAMFCRLKPCSFQLNSDSAGKKRWGFIAQDVIESAVEAGMDTEQLGAIGMASNEMYGLAYSEFTALNTHMIQKLMGRVTALEQAVGLQEGA